MYISNDHLDICADEACCLLFEVHFSNVIQIVMQVFADTFVVHMLYIC